MKKLLVICGPTATGKTQLGIQMANKYNGEIVSADSRQVYQGMDIATGKSLPEGAKLKAKSEKLQLKVRSGKPLVPYRFGGVPVWMLDVVDPKERFSVAEYHRLAREVIRDIWRRGKLPILVGGTGFYIKALIDGIDTLDIPPNPELRKAYDDKTVDELVDILFHLSPELVDNLNPSERKNKVRLIRKIEIAQTPSLSPKTAKKEQYDILLFGLTTPPKILRERINRRIDEWAKEGAEDEVLRLLGEGVKWEAQSMNAIGYRQWKPYFEKKATRDEIIKRWKQEEWQYAKRQLTWFKKDKSIKWFDVSKPGWEGKVEEMVGNWYNK